MTTASQHYDQQVRLSEDASLLSGLSTMFAVCAEVLLNEPSASVLADIRAVAQTVGDRRFDSFEPSDGLTQRYYDRVLVAASSRFVPLQESCVRRSALQEGTRRFAPSGGSHAGQVARCYQAAGFDMRLLRGFDLALRSLRADSLAAELAFVAYLLRQPGERPVQLAGQFCREHLRCWVGIAYDCLAETGDDVYVRLCSFAIEAVEAALVVCASQPR